MHLLILWIESLQLLLAFFEFLNFHSKIMKHYLPAFKSQ